MTNLSSTRRISIAALAILPVLFSTANGATAPISGPTTKGNVPIAKPADGGGGVTSPGDPFVPSRPNDDTGRPPNGGGGVGTVPDRTRPNDNSSDDLICRIHTAADRTTSIVVVNNTGATIPAGSIVVVHIQPGDIEKSFVVEKDWPAGNKITASIGEVALPKGAECSAAIKPSDTTLPKIALDTPPPPFLTGSTGPVGDADDPSKVLSAACFVFPAEGVMIYNDGTLEWPVGTHVVVTLPNGQTFDWTYDVTLPSTNATPIPPALLYYPNSGPQPGEFLPESWTCSIEIMLPAAGG